MIAYTDPLTGLRDYRRPATGPPRRPWLALLLVVVVVVLVVAVRSVR